MAEELEQANEDLVETAKAKRAAVGFIGRIALFVRQVIGELKKVTRPTTRELVNYTGVVLGFVVVIMVVILAFDLVFGKLVILTFTGKF